MTNCAQEYQGGHQDKDDAGHEGHAEFIKQRKKIVGREN